MKILALDQATKTGYAVGDGESFAKRTVESGVFKMKKRYEPGERLAGFVRVFGEIVDHYKPDLVAYEMPFVSFDDAPEGMIHVRQAVAMAGEYHGQALERELWKIASKKKIRIAKETTELLIMLRGALICECAARSLPVEAYASMTWRVTALGTGRPPSGEAKKLMMAKARAWGYDPQHEDEAEAIGILRHALHGKAADKRAQGDLLDMAKGLI